MFAIAGGAKPLNYQNDPKINDRLKELEAKINSESPQTTQTTSPSNLKINLKTFYDKFIVWFNHLPKAGQIAIASVGLIAGLALLKTLIELISLAITLAVVGVIVYIGYQIFQSSQKSKINDITSPTYRERSDKGNF